jgi:signal-transduction protein with cAMP-binding, CBS, and nucleotidyltransferase domain
MSHRKSFMNTPISSLMNSPVWSVDMDATVEAVEALMSRQSLSWVPVIEPNGAAIGVVSQSDLLQFNLGKKDPAGVPAWQICTYKPISVSTDTSIADVARLMLERRIHHVVVTRDGTMVGVVSALDFVRAFVLPAMSPKGAETEGGTGVTPRSGA